MKYLDNYTKYNRLTIIKFHHKDKRSRQWYECLCDCGMTKVIEATSIKTGQSKSCGCLQQEALSRYIKNKELKPGTKFGRLTVIRLSHIEKGRSFYLCDCSCGTQTTVTRSSLVGHHTKSCGCLVRDLAKKHGKARRLKDNAAVIKHLILLYKERAKKSGMPFKLTYSDFETLIRSPCFYCGDPHGNCRTVYKKEKFKHNGIDRKNSLLGYTKYNCVACCKLCNFAKRNTPYEEFITWIHKTAEYLKSKERRKIAA